jgi:hypothetical protein
MARAIQSLAGAAKSYDGSDHVLMLGGTLLGDKSAGTKKPRGVVVRITDQDRRDMVRAAQWRMWKATGGKD